MIQLVFYVPLSHSEIVKEAVFKAGAGQLGNYEFCSWETRGVGQFRALKGANPYIGEVGAVEKVEELKVELLCLESSLEKVIQALKETHPYETPAYFALKAVDLPI